MEKNYEGRKEIPLHQKLRELSSHAFFQERMKRDGPLPDEMIHMLYELVSIGRENARGEKDAH